MTAPRDSARVRAAAAWGDGIPQWVVTLADRCDAASQAEVARRLGYSQAVISQVLRDAYKGSLSRVEDRVRGAWMAATVACPVVGELGLDVCAENQNRPYANTNPSRIALYRACRSGCPHSNLGGQHG